MRITCRFPAMLSIVTLAGTTALVAPAHAFNFTPGDLIVSTTVYPLAAGSYPTIVPGITVTPSGATAVADGSYPNVFNNANVDASFGVATPIILNQFALSNNNTTATAAGSLNVTALAASQGVNLSTSFSSKSELALNL